MFIITKKIIEFRMPSLIKEDKTKRSNVVNYNEAHEIGILANLNNYEKQQEIRAFIERLQADDKKVQILCYDTRKEKTKIFGFNTFTKRNISFWGKFTHSDIIDFLDTKFDFLFHLDFEPDIIINKLLVLSQAHCRIGRYIESQTPFYELMIDAKTMEEFSEETYKYTKILSWGDVEESSKLSE